MDQNRFENASTTKHIRTTKAIKIDTQNAKMDNEQIQEQQTSDGNTANASGLSSKADSPMKGDKQSEETMDKKPKNLQQGFVLGATKVLDGAIGGLGVAVAAPVMGAKLGAEKNGFVGGTVGLLGGAAVG